MSHTRPRAQTKALIKQELTYRRECRSQCTKKAGWMKKVFISSLVYFRFVLWRIKLLSTCSRARIISMQIWLRSSFQNHHIYKSQWPTLCILLFAWNRTSNCDKKNCFGKIFAYKTHPNFAGNFLVEIRNFLNKTVRLITE